MSQKHSPQNQENLFLFLILYNQNYLILVFTQIGENFVLNSKEKSNNVIFVETGIYSLFNSDNFNLLKKFLWDKKRAELETSYTELKEKLEKQHKREEEEYKYTLELSRRQELQDYVSKKDALEKELEEIDEKENEDQLIKDSI